MKKEPVCEITVTGVENREWQGSVYFPASEKRVAFQSVLELIKAVEDAAKSEYPRALGALV